MKGGHFSSQPGAFTLILCQKLLLIPEPLEPHDPGNLFLRPEEIIHSKQYELWYRVTVQIVEV